MPYPINEEASVTDVIVESNSIHHKMKLNVLMLEDNEHDAELLNMYLKSSALNVQTTLVSSKAEYTKALEQEEFDVILSDHNLPQFSSLEALKIRNEKKIHVPFILVSGAIPEEYAVTILQAGANDYILKDRPQRLVTAITEAIKKQKALTDKILAEQELIKTNERLKLVGKATTDAVWDWNLKTDDLYWGDGFETLFGYNLKEISPSITSWIEHLHPDDKDRVVTGIQNFIKSEQINWIDEYQYIKADGTYATIMDRGIVLRDENGDAYRMVGAMQDITKMKEMEKDIVEQKINHQKQNTQIAVQSQEEERENIGRELHDNINQLLANAKMMIDTARNSPDIHDMCINKSYEAITLAIEETRKLSHALVPPTFNDEETFIDAVNDMVSNMNLSGNINVIANIPLDGAFKLSDEKIKLTFYRIIQEQMNNIQKYSKASKATIDLHELQNSFELIIADNGGGFECTKEFKGIGLRNMATRAELHAGTMKITSEPGKGCTIKVEIPFTAK